MDVAFLAAVASGVVLLIVVLSVFSRRISGGLKIRAEEQQRAPREPQIRRAAGVRNARQRLRRNVAAAQPARAAVDRSGEESNDDAEEKAEVIDPKLGAKKRAKLEAKAERKTQREAAEREREERRKRDQLLQEERDRQSEKERAVELLREEAEKKAREEKERREYEEYLKMKEAFSVEEEGYEESNAEEQTNLLREFLDYIKQTKVVILEDLAAHFGLKTMSVIERIHELQANGSLTGVIDDRGKFIYISQDELEAVAKFVRQYGRVSIAELAENSNRLINLNSGQNAGNTIHAR